MTRTEIPLREPIDLEMKLNRKLAKQLYNQERLAKVKMNKDLNQAKKVEYRAMIQKKSLEKD